MDKYKEMARVVEQIKKAIKKAVENGEGRFESKKNIYYITFFDGVLRLFKTDLQKGSVRLYSSEDFFRFYEICLNHYSYD